MAPGRAGEMPAAEQPFGRYCLLSELGRGGMGVVYLARDDQVGRLVALKVIGDQIAESEEFLARFAREMRIAVRLEHPNVVPVYDTGDVAGHMFIAMRYVEGSDLGRVLREQTRIEASRLARLAVMLGAALDAAHAIGLVHRDVKPANVLLTRPGIDEHAYLTDFGLAREAVSDRSLTHTGQWMGTADYISPEQLDGQLISARTDIYSMTCLLFHALTGAPPYPGTMAAKLKGHALTPMPSIGPGHPHAGEIDRVLRRGSAKQPELRYASAGDLARAFGRAVAGEGSAVEEREVATGAALSGISTQDLATLRGPDPADGNRRGRTETAATAFDYGSAETRLDLRLDPPRSADRTRPGHGPRRRAGMLTVGALVLVAIAAGAAILASGGSRHRPRQATLAASASSFVLTTLGARDGSVWYVRRGAPAWTATGQFIATGNPSLAEGGGKTVIAARGQGDSSIWYTVAGLPGWTSTAPAKVFTGSSDPTVAVSPTGQITIADRGTNNTVWYVQPGLRSWTSTARFTAVRDIALASGDGRTVIAARAPDGSIWYTTIGAPAWTLTAPASVFTGSSDPTVAVSPTGQITIADRGTNNTVWYVQPGLRSWTSTARFIAVRDIALASGDGRTVIAARAPDGSIWYTTIGAPAWTLTAPASVFTGSSDPTVAVSPTGQITIADRGTNNTVWYVQPGLRGWTSLGGFTAAGDPAVTAPGTISP